MVGGLMVEINGVDRGRECEAAGREGGVGRGHRESRGRRSVQECHEVYNKMCFSSQ